MPKLLGDTKKHLATINATLDRDNKIIFCGNYKVASTSVNRKVLGPHRGIRIKKGEKRYMEKLSSYSDADINKMFKFTIVRNPYDRALSSFDYLKSHRLIKGNFKDFMKSVKKLNLVSPHWTDRVDAHCSYQYLRAYHNDEQFVNFIARLENIEEDWEVIAKHIGGAKLPHANSSARKNDYKKYYDEKTKDLVSEIYAQDIELFGYSF